MENISNEELRGRLMALGYNPPPVTDTSRNLLIKKLRKLETNNPNVGNNISLNSEKLDVKSRKTRSSGKNSESEVEKYNDSSSSKSYGLDKSITRQTRGNKNTEDDNKNTYDRVDSSSPRKNKNSIPYDNYSRGLDPFEKGSDSDDALSYPSRSSQSFTQKPLNFRRETEYYSTVRTPSNLYRKFDNDNGVSSYLNRDIHRTKSSSGHKTNRLWILCGKFSLNKITPSIVLLAFVMFFIVVAGIYFTKNDRIYGEISIDEVKYSKCSERKKANAPCIPDNEVDVSLRCLKTIYKALWKTEADQVCGADGKAPKKILTSEDLKELLVAEEDLLRYEAEKVVKNVKVLANSNPQLNIVFKENDGFRLENAELPWQCSLQPWFSSLFGYAIYIGATIPFLLSMHILFRWGVQRHQERAKDKQELIKGILEILQQNAITNPSQSYLPIVHVRDQLILSSDRERKKKTWAEAVKYVEENESRIRREVQPYQGEDYVVWRWVGGQQISLRKPKTWHGEAFETSKDTMNTPSTSPTPCLKIRNMFDPKNETSDQDWVTGVKDAILERCEGVNVVHMMVEETNPEGCVYIKCASTDDAGKAYRKMHGAWFDGKIVSVKYLRLERYHERYKSSIDLTQPLIPSNDQKRSIV